MHVLGEDDDPVELARSADTDVLGAAGGDGSVVERGRGRGRARPALRRRPLRHPQPLCPRPRPRPGDPLAALEAFEGEERRVDVGRAGERRFLNNVSLGVYATLVHRREHHRRRRQLFAGLRALWLSLRRRRGVWAKVDGEPVEARILLAANNAYELSLFSIGERARLDEGRLHLYTAKGVLPRTWEECSGERFELDTPGGRCRRRWTASRSSWRRRSS